MNNQGHGKQLESGEAMLAIYVARNWVMEHNIEALKLKLESSVCVVSINYYTTYIATVCRAHSKMQSMRLLGGLGTCLPENFEKGDVLLCNFMQISIENSFA